YRYCCMDAGHLAVQTALAAAALGYGSRPIGRFDDAKINALLDLDQREEGAMLILPVGTVAEPPATSADRPEFALAPKELSGKSDPLLLLIHGSTALGLTGATVKPFALTQPAEKSYAGLPVVELPGGLADGDDLFATIRRRRSIREWAEPNMTVDELASVLYQAFGISGQGDLLLCDPSVEDNRALNLYAIVNEVEGLEPGVYYYRRYEHALTEIRMGDHRRARVYAASLFQEAVGNADAALVMTVDVQRLGYPDADRGYRYACLNAGMLGGRVYLQTTALQLGCCGIGAFFDDEVSELIGVSPEQELVVYLAAIGAPEPGVGR
ncbi:MAG: SagB/ThcOx family dehydrogenase, partial [Planctomycetota bacterium]